MKKYRKIDNKKKKLILKNKNEYILEIGLAFLRVILSFNVILSHCCRLNINRFIIIMYQKKYLYYHVRIFTIMSFYFSYKTFSSLNKSKIFARFQRLLIPYTLWPIIIFLLNKYILCKFLKVKIYSFKELKEQLLTGTAINHPLWYHFDLILITIVFILIIFLFRNNNKFIFLLLAITAYIYQYSGKNGKLCSKFKSNNDRAAFGRILELVPFSVTGYLIASYDIMNYFKKIKLKTFFICI